MVRREYFTAEKRLHTDSSFRPQIDRDVLIRMAFEKLTPDAREILYLVDILDFKYVDAAWVLNVPKGTVMSRVSRARAALLALVDGEDVPSDTKELRASGPYQRK